MIKRAVSKKKRRFQEHGFDLDLSYVTERVIAMGFPSQKTEGIYRNSMAEVLRFMEMFHADHYRIYNLCSERAYDHSKFHGRVARFPFDDHNPPPLSLMQPFCEDVEQWLLQDEQNIIVVHCKAGKGRTGVMIACWLLYNHMWPTAEEALLYYGAARTKDQKGVTIASQNRYVNYFSTIVKEGGMRTVETAFLRRLRFTSKPIKYTNLYFVISLRKKKVFTSPVLNMKKETDHTYIDWDINAPVMGDVLITFYEKATVGKDAKVFHLWVHTSYTEDGLVNLPKSTVDKANKDKKHKLFTQDFAVQLFFDMPKLPQKPNAAAPLGAQFGIQDTLDEEVAEDAGKLLEQGEVPGQIGGDDSEEDEDDYGGAAYTYEDAAPIHCE